MGSLRDRASACARFVLEVKRLQEETHQAEDRRTCEVYLAQAGVILAKVVQNRDPGGDVAAMERLFGHTWLKDTKARDEAYAAWSEFKALLAQTGKNQPPLSG